MGDPAGIGVEITLKAWEARGREKLPRFLLIADPALVKARCQQIDMAIEYVCIDTPEAAETAFESALPILPTAAGVQAFDAGRPTSANAASVTASIETGVEFALAGKVSALVTNPIAKSVLAEAGFGFPGHTEYLGDLARNRGLTASPVMMLCGGGLRTVPVTIHIALRDVPNALTTEQIIHTAKITTRAVTQDLGIDKPRLAITGLNPHAGEDGRMGTEERDIIVPAIEALAADGIEAVGPLPADSAFRPATRAHYDVVLAMYHDQALIPVKALAFDEGVNVTLGLPFVRTSPDHGTAFDIAGSGTAQPDSLIAALKLAADMADTRFRTLAR